MPQHTDAFPEQPNWPAQRSIERYEHLVGFSIREELDEGGVYLDIGPGTHGVALRGLERLLNVRLVGLSPVCVDVAGTRIIIEAGRVPESMELIARYSGACRVVTDIFASVTYGADPALALLAISHLIERRGKAGIFTELDKFGSADTWRAIAKFFETETGQIVEFDPFTIQGDAEPIWVDCLRIRMKGASRRPIADFAILQKALHEALGSPQLGREIWRSTDGRASIAEINYSKFQAPRELMRLKTIRQSRAE